MEDSNGNQILVRYFPGIGLTTENTSARIKEIEDVRAIQGASTWRSYTFTYNTDTIPHLTQIDSTVGGLAKRYSFTYLTSQALNSPFSPPVAFGATSLLSSVTDAYLALTSQFSYGSNNAGELTRVDLPYGAHLRWAYRDFIYSDGRTLREVQYRYLSKASGAQETTYTLNYYGGDSSGTTHSSAFVDDPGIGQKGWFFSTAADWRLGLLTSREDRPAPWQTAKRKQDFTWTQDSASNQYLSAVVTTLDQGTGYEKVSKTEQTLDSHGNLTQVKLYDYGNLSTPARTYTNTYLTGSNYTSRQIYNRVLTSTLSDGTNQVTLVSNTYDCGGGCSLSAPSGLREHDTYNYGTGFQYRGNVTQSVAQGITQTFSSPWQNPSDFGGDIVGGACGVD